MRQLSQAQVQAKTPDYYTEVATHEHTFVVDEPVSAGGQDAGPGPYDYLLVSLGACTSITLRMYAARKGWALTDLKVGLQLLKDEEGKTHIKRQLHTSAPLDDEQWQKLLDIAGKTPVTRTLIQGVTITTERV